MDLIFLAKLLPRLLYPYTLALLVMLLTIYLLRRGRIKIAIRCLIGTVLTMTVLAIPIVESSLWQFIEGYHPRIMVDDLPNVDAIVVLGGAIAPLLPPREFPDLNGSVDRLYYAAKLYNRNKAPYVILSGGNAFKQQEGVLAEARYARELLMDWGIPDHAIILEEKSRNTFENAQQTKVILDSMEISQILLVTSAGHMIRAAAVFDQAGINFIAAPTDFRQIQGYQSPWLLKIFPTAGGLASTTGALRELLGIAVYQLVGIWNAGDSE